MGQEASYSTSCQAAASCLCSVSSVAVQRILAWFQLEICILRHVLFYDYYAGDAGGTSVSEALYLYASKSEKPGISILADFKNILIG